MAFSRLFLTLFLATISSLTISSADSPENVRIFCSSASCNSEACLQALEPVQLVAPDGSVRATFIRYGATVTNFCVKDKVRSWFYIVSVLYLELFVVEGSFPRYPARF